MCVAEPAAAILFHSANTMHVDRHPKKHMLLFMFEAQLQLKFAVVVPVCSDPMPDSQVDAAKASLLAVNSALRKVNRDVRNRARQQARMKSIPQAMWHVATAIFALTHPAVEPACLFLEHKWPRWDEGKRNETMFRLQQWHTMMASTTGFGTILSPDTSAGQHHLKQARRFLDERRLHRWVDDTNKRKKIAPTSAVLLQETARSSAESTVFGLVSPTTKHKSKMQWLRRWRRRWDVVLGPLAARDTLPPEQCRKKVAVKHSPFEGFSTLDFVFARSGSPEGTRNGSQNTARILSPSFLFH